MVNNVTVIESPANRVEILGRGFGITANSTDTLINKTLDDESNHIHADVVHLLVRNISGDALSRGTPVYVSGYSSGQEKVEVDKADADGASTFPAVGLIGNVSLANNSNGEVTVSGVLGDLDTTGINEGETWNVGDSLFLSETAGQLTKIRPNATAEVQSIAKVLRSHASQGQLLIQGAGRVNASPNTVTWNRQATAVSANTNGSPIVAVTNTTAPRTITILTAHAVNGRVMVFKDESGGAGTNNITIATEGGGLIDGLSTATIAIDYGAIKLYSDGTDWFKIIDAEEETLPAYKAITGTYTIVNSDSIIECTSGTFTATLPTAIGIAGKTYNIKNSGTGLITIEGTSSQTIDRLLTIALSQDENLTVASNGADWIIL